jgi:hypothetical protein
LLPIKDEGAAPDRNAPSAVLRVTFRLRCSSMVLEGVMQAACRHRVFATRLRRWRDAAQALALLALLANAALLPGLHFASGRYHKVDRAETSYRHHAGSHDRGGESEPLGAGHQVCHFCRLLGVALPPPPLAVVERLSPAQVVERATDAVVLREERSRTANLPRAPPSRV